MQCALALEPAVGTAADTIEGYNKTSTIESVVAVTAFQAASSSASLPLLLPQQLHVSST